MTDDKPLTKEERSLVNLHHRLADVNDAEYDHDIVQLRGIADEMRAVRAAKTIKEAVAVIEWWHSIDPEGFCRKVRKAKIKVKP